MVFLRLPFENQQSKQPLWNVVSSLFFAPKSKIFLSQKRPSAMNIYVYLVIYIYIYIHVCVCCVCVVCCCL